MSVGERSCSKVKPFLDMLRKGVISVSQTSIFFHRMVSETSYVFIINFIPEPWRGDVKHTSFAKHGMK